jgi:phage gp36-like protein
MSNYATREHLEARLGSEVIDDLTDPNMPLTVVEYLDFLIENSEEFIDAYLNKWYDVPITTSADNGFLRELTLDLTEYEIWKRSIGDDVPTKYKDSYEKAMMVLEDILEGLLAPFPSSNSTNSSIDVTSDTRRMGENELKVF